MAEKTLKFRAELEDKVTGQLKNIEGGLKGFAGKVGQHRKAIGIGMTGIGGAIVGALTFATKSAIEQEQGIRRLDASLKTLGTSYDVQKEKIEAAAAALQDKTNFGDEASREAISRLVAVSGDLNLSLAALEGAADLAAFKGMKLEKAAMLVGRAISGEAAALVTFIPELENTATATEVLAAIQEKYGGQAAASRDAVAALMSRLGDLGQVISQVLVKDSEDLAGAIETIVKRIATWVEENQVLVGILVKVATGLGGIMLVLGPILLILPGIAVAVKAVAAAFIALNIAAGPATLIVIGITAAIVAAVLVFKNWDKIMAVVKKAFAEFAIIISKTMNGILKLARAVANLVPGMDDMVAGLDKSIAANEEMQAKMRATADAAYEQAFATKDAEGQIQDSAKKTAGEVVKAKQESIIASEDYVEALENEVVATEDKAKKIISWEEFIAKETVRVADEKLKATQEGIDKELEAYRENKKERERIAAEAAAEEKKILEERLAFFRGNVDDNIEQMNRLMHAQSGSIMFEDPWSDEMGRSERWKQKLEGDKKREEKQRIADEAKAALVDPIKSAMKSAGVDQHMLNKAKREIQFHVGASGLSTTSAASPDSEAFKEMASRLTSQQSGATRVAFEALAQGVDRFAGGGMSHGGLAMVGERGPELVNLPSGARVHPNGAGSMNFHFHGAVYGVEDLKRVVVEAVRDHAISGGFTGVFAEA